MTTIITRDQMRPGQIVQRVTTQTFRVLPATWTEGSSAAVAFGIAARIARGQA